MIFLDYQATTPLAPEAREAMLRWLGPPANPHAAHRAGRGAAAAISIAQDQVAAALGADAASGTLVFTSGATEAVTWAIQSAAVADPRRRRIVTIATEHACVLDTAAALARHGFDHVALPVDGGGIVDLDAAASAIDGTTALVAAMLVNNEIGVIQPVAALAALAHAAGARLLCDAVQGFGRVAVPLPACDIVAVSAHKLHGPIGIGALWLAPGMTLAPLLHGGGQQGGLRSGTLSPALAAGFGAAAALAVDRREADAAHVASLAATARACFPGWLLNGSADRRYPGNLNLRRDGVDAGRLIAEVRDVAFSAGSACASGSGRPSHVLRALGLDERQSRASIRLGFGRYTSAGEIETAAAAISAAADAQLAFA